MSNPNLRGYTLSGGPLDGKTVALLSDDDDQLPPQAIQIEADGEMTIAVAGGRILREGKQTIYLYYKLYQLARRDGKEPIWRYVYDGCYWQAVADYRTVYKSNVK